MVQEKLRRENLFFREIFISSETISLNKIKILISFFISKNMPENKLLYRFLNFYHTCDCTDASISVLYAASKFVHVRSAILTTTNVGTYLENRAIWIQ